MRSKLIGLFLVSLIAVAAPTPAKADPATPAATDGCDPQIMADMSEQSQNAFDNWNKTFADMTPKPTAAASSKCIAGIANVFDIGSLTGGQGIANLVSGALSSLLGSLMGSIGSLFGLDLSSAPTLSMASSKKLAGMAGDYFGKYLDKAVCQEAFAGVQTAFRKVNIGSTGQVTLGSAAALKGVGALSKWISSANPTTPSDMQLTIP